MAVLVEYFNYSKVFLAKKIAKFLEYTKVNNHAIKLEKGKQPLLNPIDCLESIKLEILKIYIEINLAYDFICLSKSLAKIPIFF